MEESREINSWFCIFVILLNEASGIWMGASLTSLNSAAPAIAVFVNESYEQRYSVSSPEDYNKLVVVVSQSTLAWGALIGALSVQIVIKKLSRKSAVALPHALYICSVVLVAPVAKYAKSYEALIAGRTLNGVARGLAYGVVPLVVAETTCHRRLAFFQAPFIYLIYIGAALGVGLGHAEALGTTTLWPWLLACPSVLSAVFLAIVPFLPQTPAYHLKSGNRSVARLTLRKLRCGDDASIDNELASIEAEIERDSKVHKASLVELAKNGQYRKQMIAVFITLNCPQFSGMQVVEFYSDNLFREAGVAEESVTFASLALFASCIVPGCIALFLFRRIGTKKTFLIGASLTAIGLILFTAATALKDVSGDMPKASIAAMGLYFFGQYLGIMPSMFAIPSELTTQTTRPAAMFLSSVGFWVMGSLVGFIFPYSLSAWCAYAYIPFIFALVGAIVYVFFSVPNMHKKSVDQIQQRLSISRAARKAERRENAIFAVNEAFEQAE